MTKRVVKKNNNGHKTQKEAAPSEPGKKALKPGTTQPSGKQKKRGPKKRSFSKLDLSLISLTGLVTFGGIIFCTIMIILLTSIRY